jgi:hypothetical protein
MGIALGIAGVGISCCFPTVAAAITNSVPHKDVGIASGANSMLRELGGVVGIAVMASVFTRHGVYASPRIFIDGFTDALWVAVGFSLVGAFAATLMPWTPYGNPRTRPRGGLTQTPASLPSPASNGREQQLWAVSPLPRYDKTTNRVNLHAYLPRNPGKPGSPAGIRVAKSIQVRCDLRRGAPELGGGLTCSHLAA